MVKNKSKSLAFEYEEIKKLQDIANLLRRDSLHLTTSAGTGHPTSCLSSAEIMAVLFFNEMRCNLNDAQNQDNDEFILSKGHAAPILYSALNRLNLITEPLSNFRKLKGHLDENPINSKEEPWIKIASGSSGQGMSVGLGIALAQKMQHRKSRTYVLLGDSEIAEGSVYEACELASFYKVKNLCAILDMNRLGQNGETSINNDVQVHKKRFSSLGFEVFICDGHSIAELLSAFQNARESLGPSIIIARTVKGKGVSFLENKDGWHGKSLNEEELAKAYKEIPAPSFPKISLTSPLKPSKYLKKDSLKVPPLDLNEDISTREAYGRALENLASKDERVIAVDAEVSNSTFSEIVKRFQPDQFIESFFAEQNMIGMSLGLSLKGYHVFASSFAAFLTRAHDQLRMAALSHANMTICGSNSGISIGEDSVFQMGLDDISMFRGLTDSIIFYPSDAISTEKLLDLANKTKGIKYIRTTKAKTPVIYNKKDQFEIGAFKVLKESEKDSIVLIGAGITLHECLKAQVLLKSHNIHAAVIDLYCIKPLDINKLKHFIKKHGDKLIVAEDHYSVGGLGEMLSLQLIDSGIRVKSLAISKTPHSGSPNELLEKYGINARHIAMHARTFV